MTGKQWQQLIDLIQGKIPDQHRIGFIIDSPWLPGWAGISTMHYFASDQAWLDANLKAVTTFPGIIFMPGFWAEFGMCTEPSAFGARCTWHQNDLPFSHKIIHDIKDIDKLVLPDPATDGLAPFVLHRLMTCRKEIEQAGHAIRFAVARGPLNIASFLMGTTEFLIALRTDTERVNQLLGMVTEYTIRWLELQKKTFDSIDGIFILDDIVGFCGEPDFKAFAEPYLKQIFNCLDVSVRFFHNDADGKVCASFLPGLGVNLFNYSFLHPLDDMKQWTDNKVVLAGNIPPRDILALGSTAQIEEAVKAMVQPLSDYSRILFSCGGGMPDGVSTEHILAFQKAVESL